MKKLETGISTEIVNGHIYVYNEKDLKHLKECRWWPRIINKKLC